MFTEILKIKPVLDSATASEMETKLQGRFTRVAKRFSTGLKNAIKGTVFGIGLGLLAQLLNPLENIEKKIRSLLDDSKDVNDLAERFGAKGGELLQAQTIAKSANIPVEKFNELLTDFAKSVEQAREEAKTPTGVTSANATAVEKFIGEKDLVAAFWEFLRSLQTEAKGSGRTDILADGTVIKRSGQDISEAAQKAVFGEIQYGAGKRLLNLDFERQNNKVGLPNIIDIQKAVSKGSNLSDVEAAITAKNGIQNYIDTATKATSEMVSSLQAIKQREEKQQIDQFNNFEQLKKGTQLISDLQGTLLNVQSTLLGVLNALNNLPSLIGKGGTLTQLLSTLTSFLTKFQNTKLFRGITGGGSE